MQDIFKIEEKIPEIETRSNRQFKKPKVRTVYKGENSLRYFGPVVWDEMLSNEYKNYTSLLEFKNAIKEWVPMNCNCRLCKTYLPRIGFT